jgi:hypothetical protein
MQSKVAVAWVRSRREVPANSGRREQVAPPRSYQGALRFAGRCFARHAINPASLSSDFGTGEPLSRQNCGLFSPAKQSRTLGGQMGRVILYAIILVQFLGGLLAFYRVDPRVLVSAISLQNGFFLGLFLLIHLLGLVGAILVVLRLRWGLFLSIAHQVLMVLGLKVGTTFVFLTHDVVSFFLFFVSSFGEYSWAYRWSIGMGSIFAQLAANTRGTYIGINVFALGCAAYLWWAMKEVEAERAELARRPQRRPEREAPMDGRQPPRRAG